MTRNAILMRLGDEFLLRASTRRRRPRWRLTLDEQAALNGLAAIMFEAAEFNVKLSSFWVTNWKMPRAKKLSGRRPLKDIKLTANHLYNDKEDQYDNRQIGTNRSC